jgi:hypothetical protein
MLTLLKITLPKDLALIVISYYCPLFTYNKYEYTSTIDMFIDDKKNTLQYDGRFTNKYTIKLQSIPFMYQICYNPISCCHLTYEFYGYYGYYNNNTESFSITFCAKSLKGLIEQISLNIKQIKDSYPLCLFPQTENIIKEGMKKIDSSNINIKYTKKITKQIIKYLKKITKFSNNSVYVKQNFELNYDNLIIGHLIDNNALHYIIECLESFKTIIENNMLNFDK